MSVTLVLVIQKGHGLKERKKNRQRNRSRRRRPSGKKRKRTDEDARKKENSLQWLGDAHDECQSSVTCVTIDCQQYEHTIRLPTLKSVIQLTNYVCQPSDNSRKCVTRKSCKLEYNEERNCCLARASSRKIRPQNKM